MSMNDSTTQTFRILRCHRSASCELPPPDVEWVTDNDMAPDLHEVGDDLANVVRRFVEHGIIQPVGYADPQSSRRIYVTNPKSFRWVEQNIRENTTWTPCGHTGVRNLGDGEFTCVRDHCDETFPRSVAEEVLNGE